MSSLAAIMLGVILWIALIALWWVIVVPFLRNAPNRDATTALMWWGLRAIGRFIHRVRFDGLGSLRDDADAGPFIVVSNHTGSVDPLLIQAGCRFHIRWMMADNQMLSSLDWLWKHQQIIPVARAGEDLAALREGIRHVKDGRSIGIFPEARLVYPRGQVWPFMEGVGLIVRRTKTPVLLVLVTGTPESMSMKGVTMRSHALVQYLEVIEYDTKLSATEITADLRRRISAASGWPIVDDAPPMIISRPDPFVPVISGEAPDPADTISAT